MVSKKTIIVRIIRILKVLKMRKFYKMIYKTLTKVLKLMNFLKMKKEINNKIMNFNEFLCVNIIFFYLFFYNLPFKIIVVLLIVCIFNKLLTQNLSTFDFL